MGEIIVYAREACPFCRRALKLLRDLGQRPVVIDLKDEPHRRGEMIAKAGGRTTVPQIFIDGEHIGGCDELLDLQASDKLVPKLAR